MSTRNIRVFPKDERYTEKVKREGYIKKIPVNEKMLDQIRDEQEAEYNLMLHYLETHPDSLQTAKLTFLYENQYHVEHPEECDVLFIDAPDAPEVDAIPEFGVPNTVIKHKGVYYLANKTGRYKQYAI